MRVGEVARLYAEMLAQRSKLPLVQKELFDRNPGDWTLDDEAFSREHDQNA